MEWLESQYHTIIYTVERNWELPPIAMPVLSFWLLSRGEKLVPHP